MVPVFDSELSLFDDLLCASLTDFGVTVLFASLSSSGMETRRSVSCCGEKNVFMNFQRSMAFIIYDFLQATSTTFTLK